VATSPQRFSPFHSKSCGGPIGPPLARFYMVMDCGLPFALAWTVLDGFILCQLNQFQMSLWTLGQPDRDPLAQLDSVSGYDSFRLHGPNLELLAWHIAQFDLEAAALRSNIEQRWIRENPLYAPIGITCVCLTLLKGACHCLTRTLQSKCNSFLFPPEGVFRIPRYICPIEWQAIFVASKHKMTDTHHLLGLAGSV
jgi:hypothetical protein